MGLSSTGGSPTGRDHSWQRTSTIDLKIEPQQLDNIMEYLIAVLERNPYLSQLSKSSVEGGKLLQYRLSAKDGSLLDVAVKFQPDKIEIFYAPYPLESIKEKEYVSLDMELETLIRSYFADQSKASLYLVFSPKMNMLPASREKGIRRLLGSVVFGNMLYLFLIVLFIGIFLYPFFGIYTPLVIVAVQFILVYFASSLIAARGEFDITPDNQSIHIAELRMKRNEFDQVIKSCLPRIGDVKKKIYDSTLALGNDLSQSTIVKTLNEYGAVCTPEFVKIKTVNVYDIVKDLATKFRFRIPRITLLNVLPPNAAATGVSPNKATVMVTSGLIATMDEEEIKTVLAHEFSHVRARDPLVLLTLVTVEYLLRVYVLWPYIASFSLVIDLVYLFLSFTVLFFIAKFLEARADLDAAIMTGAPKVLASSLRKLGLWRYNSRAFELVNAGEWIKWDPHPPLYYRIRTLESMDPGKSRHTFIDAVAGCIKGFFDSLQGK